MNFLKGAAILLLIAFIIIQFFRPEKNSSAAPVQHISGKFSLPKDVEHILSTSCYDCHSNNTRYPWYSHIQPVGWWLDGHIRDGKKHLNFDEFTSYTLRRQYHKFEEIVEMVKKDEMPLPSYLVGHRDAVLSPEQKEKIILWSNNSIDVMKTEYPIDSLVRQ